ncbi:MAG: hypothetical protein JNM86_03025 [Phycisphaerae bacterium]|nr:hypothetical protein [Phycisphaerae bacterium]
MCARFFVAACAAGLVASTSGAAIVSVSGQVTQIAQPLNAQLNALTNPTTAYCWDEVQNFALDRVVAIDAFAPGTYNQTGDLVSASLGVGTVVRSHYIHFDIQPQSGSATVQGRVRFDSNIIGVIVVNEAGARHLDDSDFLGAPTLFTHGNNNRGLEFATDAFRITILGDAIEFDLTITQPGDYIRILTQGDIPAPGSLAVGTLGLLCIARRKR